MLFCCLLLFFSKSTFSKNSFRNTISVSNRLDPDQAQCFVSPDLGPISLPRLLADELVGNVLRIKDFLFFLPEQQYII